MYVQAKYDGGEVGQDQLVCPCVEPDKCAKPLAPAEVARCLKTPEDRARYERLALQRYVDTEDDTSCCPTAGCEYAPPRL